MDQSPTGDPSDQSSSDLDIAIGTVRELWHDFLAHLPQLVFGLLTLLAFALLAGIASWLGKRALKRTRIRPMLQDLFRQITVIALWIVGLLVTAVIIFPDMTPSKALTALGVGSIAIGFAFKDIFENFFAGVLILWRFPFEIDDWIVCTDHQGKVEETTIRMTIIRQADGQLITLPNAMLLKEAVRVITDRDRRRYRVTVGVHYDSDHEEARRILEQAIESCDLVDSDHPRAVLMTALGESSIDFDLYWWGPADPWSERRCIDQVLSASKRDLDAAGIVIPFPQRTLTFGEGITVRRESVSPPEQPD